MESHKCDLKRENCTQTLPLPHRGRVAVFLENLVSKTSTKYYPKSGMKQFLRVKDRYIPAGNESKEGAAQNGE